MRNYVFIFICLTWNSALAQNLEVVRVTRENLTTVSPLYGRDIPDSVLRYKIICKNNRSDRAKLSYPIRLGTIPLDTISLIEELLTFQGDSRICVLPISCWNLESSALYFRKSEDYSIQVEALFIINQLYYPEAPFAYSAFPVLRTSKEEESIDGPLVREAYKSYRQWFRKVKAMGLRKARQSGLAPLDDANLVWFR